MDIHGNTVGKTNLRSGVPITELAWNCERFNMEEQPDQQNNLNNIPQMSSSNHHPTQPKPYLRPDGNYTILNCLRLLALCWRSVGTLRWRLLGF
jgi:hypothetical protein